MSFYEQICETRERVLKSDNSSYSRNEEIKVLSQLLNLAFNNRQHPDELPKIFRIHNSGFKSVHLFKTFLTFSVHLEVKSVKLVNTDWVRGNTFEVELI